MAKGLDCMPPSIVYVGHRRPKRCACRSLCASWHASLWPKFASHQQKVPPPTRMANDVAHSTPGNDVVAALQGWMVIHAVKNWIKSMAMTMLAIALRCMLDPTKPPSGPAKAETGMTTNQNPSASGASEAPGRTPRALDRKPSHRTPTQLVATMQSMLVVHAVFSLTPKSSVVVANVIKSGPEPEMEALMPPTKPQSTIAAAFQFTLKPKSPTTCTKRSPMCQLGTMLKSFRSGWLFSV
mmetsp:Transcript_7792/g.29262  ORF Transcript_7792/g.29262 Transcript_7792/m.29262 type:complete len:239 (-) Transcript_7792:712-1428(-)